MDNSEVRNVQGGQVSQQQIDGLDDDYYQSDKSTEDMVRYVRQVGKLNKANRQLVAGVERSKFSQTS